MSNTDTGALLETSIFGDQTVQRIERDDAGQLVVHLDGSDQPVTDAKVRKCFPWSVPEGYLSVRDSDGKEVVLLKTLDELDDASRDVVTEELERTTFNPQIHKILNFRHEFGVTSVTADTDRGQVTFQIRSRDDVRLLGGGRALFRDADGNTYELPDINELDPASQKRLQQYF
jgi:hypothetical protein